MHAPSCSAAQVLADVEGEDLGPAALSLLAGTAPAVEEAASSSKGPMASVPLPPGLGAFKAAALSALREYYNCGSSEEVAARCG
jgi:hypothetical protein